MSEFNSGQYVIFKNELIDKLFSEGYLLRQIYINEPINYWIITEDNTYKNAIIKDIYEKPDSDFYNNPKVIIVREKYIKEYSEKTRKKFVKIDECLNRKFIKNNINIEFEPKPIMPFSATITHAAVNLNPFRITLAFTD